MSISDTVVWAPCLAFVLATVSTIAYVLGKRTTMAGKDDENLWTELSKAKSVVRELEATSHHIRRMLAAHHANVKQFQQRMSSLNHGPQEKQLLELTREAERMLRPTMRLSSEMAQAYDEVRKQANLLMSVTQSRTDPLTGLENRQSMEEALKGLFAMQARYNSDFSVAIVDIDQFKRLNDEHGHLFGDKILQQVADALSRSVRETDSIARFGGEEFIVTMQHTDLEGACIYAQRFRDEVSIDLPITVSIGVTGALEGDTVQSLLTRADTALYSAKSAGRNCVYRHDGALIEPVELSDGLDVDELDVDELDRLSAARHGAQSTEVSR